jgi:Flp pilus assembly protein CpaB
MVAHTVTLSVWETEAGDLEFKASMGYVRHCLRKQTSKSD